MRTALALALAALCALAAAASVVPAAHHKKVVADKPILTKQKGLVQLLVRVQQPNMFLEQKSIGEQWDIEAHLDSYTDAKVAKKFVTMWKKNTLMPRGEIFSMLRDYQMEEAIALFDLFYFAKDFDTFYKTACWARDRVNEGVFVYALHVAVMHRQDCKQIVLPPIFEILPHFFIDARTIEMAIKTRMQYAGITTQDSRTVIIPTNYTRSAFMRPNPEYMMTPWTEDVGINAYYTYFHAMYPFWMTTERYGKTVERYGELYYYVQKQILTRYNLQRLALGLPEVEYLQFDKPIKYGYSPMLRYANGMEVPARPDYYYITNNYEFDKIKVWDYERRFRDAIDFGYVISKDGSKISIYEEKGFEILGKLIAGTHDSINYKYYGALYSKLRRLLATAVDPNYMHGTLPGVTQYFFTALRDPAYYQACARVDYLFRSYKEKLERYTVDQLSFPGVRIEGVEIDKLITFFDDFDVDLMNAIDVSSAEDGERLKIVARIQRLNYKPFTYKFTVNSDKEANVMVRVFLGPKYDAAGNEMKYDEMRKYMVEMDRFPYKVTTGQTVITRNSYDSTFTMKDRSTVWDLLRKTDRALNNQEEMYIDEVSPIEPLALLLYEQHIVATRGRWSNRGLCGRPWSGPHFLCATFQYLLPLFSAPLDAGGSERGLLRPAGPLSHPSLTQSFSPEQVAQYCGFPQRLLLPKVYKTSMPFVFFAMVTPYDGPMDVPKTFASCGAGFDVKYPDSYPMGFPFDRPIKDWEFFTPNMYFKDVLIFHKKTGDINTL